MTKNLNEQSEYRILFTNVNYANDNVLTHLYMPLIKANAYELYNWLRSEQIIGVTSSENFNQIHHRILICLQLSMSEFVTAKNTLEKYKLLTTYYDEVNDCFLYSLNNPLSVDQFINDVVLKNKLIQIIGKKEYEKTLLFLKPIDLSGIYNDVSAQFSEEDLNTKNEPELFHYSYKFDFNLLFTDLLKQNVLLDLSSDERTLIEAFFNSQSYSYLDIKNAVLKSLQVVTNKTNTYTLDVSSLQQFLKSQKTQNVIVKKQENPEALIINKRDKNLFLSLNYDFNQQQDLLQWYSHFSFESLYKFITKENPTKIVVTKVQNVANLYGFDQLVINLITDFVIFQIGKFNPLYFKKVCQTLNNLNFFHASDVLSYLRKINNKNVDLKAKKNKETLKTQDSPNIFEFLKD